MLLCKHFTLAWESFPKSKWISLKVNGVVYKIVYVIPVVTIQYSGVSYYINHWPSKHLNVFVITVLNSLLDFNQAVSGHQHLKVQSTTEPQAQNKCPDTRRWECKLKEGTNKKGFQVQFQHSFSAAASLILFSMHGCRSGSTKEKHLY